MGINKEYWTDIIREEFFPEIDFLNEPMDMSAFVDNDILHFAEAGVKPNVLKNNNSFPVATNARTDVDKARTLDTFDSENTVVRNLDELLTQYDKASSVMRQHQNSLYERVADDASYNYMPAANAATTPVIETTGGLDSGFRAMTRQDIISMANRMDRENIPRAGRVIVLHPDGLADIQKQDIALFNQISSALNGTLAGDIYGLKPYVYAQEHLYVAANTKKAFGATYAATDKYVRAFAFHKEEVFKAMGSIDLFATYNDPGARGDIFGLQMRFHAATIRDKAIGVIITATT